MAAAWEGDASVVAELLKHGANATLVNSERRSALMLAERSSALSLAIMSEISIQTSGKPRRDRRTGSSFSTRPL